MAQPDFRTLPEVGPVAPGYRWVGSMMMVEEQYTVEGWYPCGPKARPAEHSYTVDHPTRGPTVITYWAATLAGLRRYGQLIASRRDERIAAARTRRESDDEWSSHVQSLIDAKEYGP